MNALRLLADAADDHGVQIAIITAVSVVIAALVTAAAQFLQDRNAGADENHDPTQALLEDLLRRAEQSDAHAETMQARIDYLETLCWRNGVDPDTGRKTLPDN